MNTTYATSNEKMQEHLCEMMERLLDDELFKDKKKAMQEIEKARAMSNLVSSSLEMQKVEVQQTQLKINAMKLLLNAGYTLNDMQKAGISIGNNYIKGAKNEELPQSVD